ncbi:unnamed protein product [Amoebophrya sp. A120]|nr:unnamed protein product [Amoebophrya sp. A120]|eukprot:GSA120T00019915001.1
MLAQNQKLKLRTRRRCVARRRKTTMNGVPRPLYPQCFFAGPWPYIESVQPVSAGEQDGDSSKLHLGNWARPAKDAVCCPKQGAPSGGEDATTGAIFDQDCCEGAKARKHLPDCEEVENQNDFTCPGTDGGFHPCCSCEIRSSLESCEGTEGYWIRDWKHCAWGSKIIPTGTKIYENLREGSATSSTPDWVRQIYDAELLGATSFSCMDCSKMKSKDECERLGIRIGVKVSSRDALSSCQWKDNTCKVRATLEHYET